MIRRQTCLVPESAFSHIPLRHALLMLRDSYENWRLVIGFKSVTSVDIL